MLLKYALTFILLLSLMCDFCIHLKTFGTVFHPNIKKNILKHNFPSENKPTCILPLPKNIRERAVEQGLFGNFKVLSSQGDHFYILYVFITSAI